MVYLECGVPRVRFGNLFVRLRENPLCDFVVEYTQVKGVNKKFGVPGVWNLEVGSL